MARTTDPDDNNSEGVSQGQICNSEYVIMGLLAASIFFLSLIFNIIAIVRMKIEISRNIAKY